MLLVVTGCSSRSAPAPVTTLELRENFYQQRNRGTLTSSTYVVQRGDTLYSIAFRAALDVRTLAERNSIASPYVIHPGQVLYLTKSAPNTRTASQRQAASTTKVPAASQPSNAAKGSNNASKATNAATKQTVNSTPAINRQTTAPVPVITNRNASTNTPAKTDKAVAPSTQKGYGQTEKVENQKVSGSTPSGNRVQWGWPVRGKIVSGFSNQQNGNKGLDIAGAEGSRINAAAAGQVVYAGNALRGYGNLIIIKHNDDYLSAYAHNKTLLVTEKQWVTAGQQIALMGSTDATDTRLHFEIRFRGTSVDPLKYLPK